MLLYREETFLKYLKTKEEKIQVKLLKWLQIILLVFHVYEYLIQFDTFDTILKIIIVYALIILFDF